MVHIPQGFKRLIYFITQTGAEKETSRSHSDEQVTNPSDVASCSRVEIDRRQSL
jgi:hypothetical protein